MNDEKLNSLFAVIKDEEPKVSFQASSRAFLRSLGVGGIGIVLSLFVRKWKPIQIIVMTTSTILIVAAGFLSAPSSSTSEQLNAQHFTSREPQRTSNTRSSEDIEIIYVSQEDTFVQRIQRTEFSGIIRQIEPLPTKQLLSKIAPSILPMSPVFKKDTLITSERIFWIKRNMHDSEMETIREEATAAGIEFDYRLLVWKGEVRRCTFWMKFENPNGGVCTYQSELKGRFNKQIRWIQDASGKAIQVFE